MTYAETCAHFGRVALQKSEASKKAPLGFLVGCLFAGAYVGIALILAYTCSAGLPAGVRPLVNGTVFGIGLVLVVFAGAEMFTGHVMYMTFGLAQRTITPLDALRVLVYVWIGNLIGATLLAWIFAKGGGGAIFGAGPVYFHDIVMKKEMSTVLALLCRATLCNWLVCLAIWGAFRIANEAGKIWFIGWCLLAFVACGFEHSVANMTAFTLGLFDNIGTIYGMFYNLLWVTIGNFIGGGILVAGAYMLASKADSVPGAPQVIKA
jgi:nitrite transporter NirC